VLPLHQPFVANVWNDVFSTNEDFPGLAAPRLDGELAICDEVEASEKVVDDVAVSSSAEYAILFTL